MNKCNGWSHWYGLGSQVCQCGLGNIREMLPAVRIIDTPLECQHCGDKRKKISKVFKQNGYTCENIRACNTRRIKQDDAKIVTHINEARALGMTSSVKVYAGYSA
jgi:hypothetical protein